MYHNVSDNSEFCCGTIRQVMDFNYIGDLEVEYSHVNPKKKGWKKVKVVPRDIWWINFKIFVSGKSKGVNQLLLGVSRLFQDPSNTEKFIPLYVKINPIRIL